ncbi:DNA internalization-related competence protein ComEC/Rec2 [Ligilactobacillus animalis]|uniref:DNA internalization-related competence protein ComEC/Rec2 n=2 Tax=Ligilactobacillus animalis TaxID=1605 RepID=A0AAJ6K4A4_9LACO|nr:DNA internalization-related competence protein ComEC/Rec2 [Ligilactobacillus animalis]MDO5883204.1 DNA internalization-related competence protein ComEC/Rec2 [Ligilactobacillus animalis]MDU3186470.1 DNA internalization-related competence protein ComEC/Rec2 [Ligilactobacillus animalis]MDU8986127.1 DNA internalization-related competence protein ComEC/Rec2 [Ligilactobacillus animalis]THE21611.1 competence protein ComE [Ligilactobacillus animalis]THE22326.1 competence protein ComE [Ligilactobaci
MLLLTAFVAVSLSFLILDHTWMAGMVVLVLFLRLLATKNIHLISSVLVICVFFSIRFYTWQQNVHQVMQVTPDVTQKQHLLIYSDETKISGDLLTFKAWWWEKRQWVNGYYRIRTLAEKKTLLQINKTKIWNVTGKVLPLQAPTNEAQFDWRRFYQGKNIFLAFAVTHYTLQKVPPGQMAWRGRLHDLRQALRLKLKRLPRPLDWYSATLLLGIRSSDADKTLADITRLGLLYLFSLSGLHVFYVVKTLRRFLKLLRLPKWLEILVVLGVLPVYAILGGASASLVRAVWMCWLKLATRLIKGVRLKLATIWAVVLLLELWRYPALFYQLGAQLSYLLTLVIVTSKTSSNWLFNLKLNAFSAPLVLYYTYQWNFLTFLITGWMNLIFEYIILPVTFIGAVVPFLQNLAAQLLQLISSGLNLLARLPSNLILGRPPLIMVLFWLGVLLWLQGSSKKIRWLALLGMSYFLTFLLLRYPLSSEVVYFDIGQGDCTLIRERFSRRVILIDTGGKVHFSMPNWKKHPTKTSGETIVANYLLSKGITRIDQLYLTHQDADHVGNFPSLSQLIKIKQIIVPAGMENLPSFKHRLAKSAVMPEAVKGVTDRVKLSDPHLKLLHPFARGQGTNADSLVLWLDFYGLKCIFTGDLDRKGELAVSKKYPNLTADVLKMGHHGSKTATDPKFVQQLAPKVAIISAGRHNRYGHPNQETLVTLQKAKVPYYVTAKVGMIKFTEMLGYFSFWDLKDN